MDFIPLWAFMYFVVPSVVFIVYAICFYAIMNYLTDMCKKHCVDFTK
jgi:hypothetical protein